MSDLIVNEYSLVAALERWAMMPGEHPNDADPEEHDSDYFSSVKETSDDEWDCGMDYNSALEAARRGLTIEHEYKALISSFDRVTEVDRPSYVFDDSGDEIDIGLYLADEPDCFLQMTTLTGAGVSPLVELLVPVGALGYISAHTMRRRGVAIYALCEALEKAGKAVGVTICAPRESSGSSYMRLDTRIRIKEPFENLNPKRLFYFLTHPTVARRLIFRLLEQLPEETREEMGIHEGYGATRDLADDEIKPGTIYCPGVVGREEMFKDTERTAKWVREMLTEQGVTCGNE